MENQYAEMVLKSNNLMKFRLQSNGWVGMKVENIHYKSRENHYGFYAFQKVFLTIRIETLGKGAVSINNTLSK